MEPISEKDSDIIYDMVRQIRKGVWHRRSLLNKLYETKGAKPTNVSINKILDYVDASGGRWGIVPLGMSQYSVWGAAPVEKKKEIIAKVPPEDSIYEEVVAKALKIMPKTTVKFSSFQIYLGNAFRVMGLSRMPTTTIARDVVSGKIRSRVRSMEIDGITWVDII